MALSQLDDEGAMDVAERLIDRMNIAKTRN